MEIVKKLVPLFCITLFLIFISQPAFAKLTTGTTETYKFARAEADDEGYDPDADEEEYEYEDEEQWGLPQAYKRLYYTFGIGGSYWTKNKGMGIDGTVGAYSCLEFRFSKYASVGFDTFYGYLAGTGTQYLSSFNPGVKIFPMGHKNPTLEPFVFVGGHAFDAAFGSSARNKYSMGQGGFGGIGFKWYSDTSMFGITSFVRASFLYMQQLNGGPRKLTIPIFFALGFTN